MQRRIKNPMEHLWWFFFRLGSKYASTLQSILEQPPEVLCRKKLFLKISQNSQENTCQSLFFIEHLLWLLSILRVIIIFLVFGEDFNDLNQEY